MAVLLLGLSFRAAAQVDEEPLVTFDLPAAEALTSLKAFSAQSGVELIFKVEAVRDVRTPAVQGRYTANRALGMLLEGTPLMPMRDEETGAIAIVRRDAANPDRTGASSLRLEAYEVNATKVDGVINRGLLQGGENAALYHDVVSRADIERMGVSSIEELFRYLPQTSSPGTSLQIPVGNTRTTGGLINSYSTIGLRGFESAQTVILVNGRAMPRTGLGNGGGPDLSRIPIAAIERVELLPYAGSAIYGAGALGGAINIILRKEFSGRDLTAYIGTSTEGGATEYRFTYLDGRTFREGRTNLTVTLSYHHRDALRGNDRDYLDEALRRYGPDSTARNAQGVPYFEQLILPAFAAAPGTILVANTPGSAVNDLGIPGAPGVRFAAIPLGLTPGQNTTLTPADFTATAGEANLAPRYGRSILYQPIDSFSLTAIVEHEFFADRLDGYGEFTLGHSRQEYSMPQGLVVNLSETDPLNPFRTGVTPGFVGRRVNIYLDTPDLPDPEVTYDNQSVRAVAGLKGRFTDTWEWTADATVDYADNTVDSANPTTNFLNYQELTPYTEDGPSAPAAERRAIYALFADHTVYPIDGDDVATYFDQVRHSYNRGLQAEGNVRVMGEVFELPAGPLRASALGKYQDWTFDSGDSYTGSEAWSQLIHGIPFDAGGSDSSASRSIWQGAVEVSVPVISERWRPVPFIDAFDIQASFSREKNKTDGTDANGDPFANRQSSDSAVIAGKLQITPDVAFRASYSEGFYPPNWSDVSLPTSTFSLPGFFPDPKRGNTLQFTPNMTIMQGGNPDLEPETAESENLGVILTPRFMPGFSLNVDYWRIEKVDAIVSQSFTNIIANPDAFGFLITREDPTAEEAARGWLGRITAIDARNFNASITRTEGVDIRTRYTYDTATLGTFGFIGSASFTNKFLLLATPTAPIIDAAGGAGPVRWRGHASVTWQRDRWSATVTGRYVGHRSTPTTDPSESFPGAFPIDGGRLPAFLRADVQLSYEQPYATGSKNWFQGTKWTLGVLNVANDRPTFVSDGTGFYDTYDDPRQRFVYVQIKKSL